MYAIVMNTFLHGSGSSDDAVSQVLRADGVIPAGRSAAMSVTRLVILALDALKDSFNPSLSNEKRIILTICTIGLVGYLVYWIIQLFNPPFVPEEAADN